MVTLITHLAPLSVLHGQMSRLACLCAMVIPDGISTSIVIEHRMNISAADLAAGFPTIEIVNPNTAVQNPYVPTQVTHTTLTGLAARLGVTVTSSLTDTITLGIANPALAQGMGPAAAFMVMIMRNQAKH